MSGHRYDRDSALAAGLKGNAGRTPEQASEIARKAAAARWAGVDTKRPRYPLLKGDELDYWVRHIPLARRLEMTVPQLRRYATMLARQAVAQVAAEASRPAGPAVDGFAILRAQRIARLEAGGRDE